MHSPVLLKNVVELLEPQSNEHFIDCTLGSGGHTRAILERNGPKGKVLALDQDPDAIERAKTSIQKAKYRERLILVQENFANLKEVVQREKFRPVRGILFDLGMSLEQLEESKRGFSFQKAEPLDMRYTPANPLSAEKIVNFFSRQSLEKILREYGEERFAKEIAQALVQKRAHEHISKTTQLVKIIEEAVPRWYQRKKIHAATRTFQALRIAVNQELENLKAALSQSPEVLEPEGRLLVISFHSLEDRIVKNFLKNNPLIEPLNKKPITPSLEEIRGNPRSRSAKLRAGIKKR